MSLKNKLLLAMLIVLPLFALDQYTKWLAIANLKGEDSLLFLSGFFSLVYSENTGAMLSFGANLPDNMRFILLTVITGLSLFAGFLYLLMSSMSKHSFAFGLLILAGGIGNLYDRVFDGYVIDFMILHFGLFKTGVFNVADVAIMIGCFGFLLSNGRQEE